MSTVINYILLQRRGLLIFVTATQSGRTAEFSLLPALIGYYVPGEKSEQEISKILPDIAIALRMTGHLNN
jgi:Tfp pilus assembly ATPase PilU